MSSTTQQRILPPNVAFRYFLYANKTNGEYFPYEIVRLIGLQLGVCKPLSLEELSIYHPSDINKRYVAIIHFDAVEYYDEFHLETSFSGSWMRFAGDCAKYCAVKLLTKFYQWRQTQPRQIMWKRATPIRHFLNGDCDDKDRIVNTARLMICMIVGGNPDHVVNGITGLHIIGLHGKIINITVHARHARYFYDVFFAPDERVNATSNERQLAFDCCMRSKSVEIIRYALDVERKDSPDGKVRFVLADEHHECMEQLAIMEVDVYLLLEEYGIIPYTPDEVLECIGFRNLPNDANMAACHDKLPKVVRYLLNIGYHLPMGPYLYYIRGSHILNGVMELLGQTTPDSDENETVAKSYRDKLVEMGVPFYRTEKDIHPNISSIIVWLMGNINDDCKMDVLFPTLSYEKARGKLLTLRDM